VDGRRPACSTPTRSSAGRSGCTTSSAPRSPPEPAPPSARPSLGTSTAGWPPTGSAPPAAPSPPSTLLARAHPARRAWRSTMERRQGSPSRARAGQGPCTRHRYCGRPATGTRRGNAGQARRARSRTVARLRRMAPVKPPQPARRLAHCPGQLTNGYCPPRRYASRSARCSRSC
jgi:hypothetical protein